MNAIGGPVAKTVGAALLVLSMAACQLVAPTGLRTAQAPASDCEMALLTGTLVEDPRSGLGIQDGAGVVTPVMWPFGFSTRMDFGGTALVDANGAVVAQVGETIKLGGGLGREFWVACGVGIERVRR